MCSLAPCKQCGIWHCLDHGRCQQWNPVKPVTQASEPSVVDLESAYPNYTPKQDAPNSITVKAYDVTSISPKNIYF